MAKLHISTKRLQIDKANTTMVMCLAICSFVTVFALVATRALLVQRSYQSKVIAQKQKARDQLVKNIAATDSLVTSYKVFIEAPENIIGGFKDGQSDRDGDNAKIVLDALPSKYDFPALTSSLEKILSERAFKIDDISGTDDEVAQADNILGGDPVPIEIPFQIDVGGSYTAIQDLLVVFERSIRPFHAQTLILSGGNGSMKMNFSGITYYQPEKTLSITTSEVR